MEFEWDERKRIINLAKHGVDFRDVVRFVWDRVTTSDDQRRDYGEERLIAVAPLDGRLHVLVYTMRSGVHRIISLRKASDKEINRYEAEVDSPNAGRE